MSIISRLKVWIGSDTSDLEKGLKKSKREVGLFGQGVTKLGGMIAGAFALDRIRSFATESIRLAKVQADAEKKLEAVLRATGGAAGLSAGELKRYASELQNVTLYGNEATIAAMGMMASFKSIRGDVFKEAIKAVQDMSTVMNTDLKQSVLQVGKALEIPEVGMSALRDAGVGFTAEQMAEVKKLIAEGKKQEAQLIILKELQGEFGGASRAMASDTHGAMVQLNNTWGDFKETIGQALLDMKPVLSVIQKLSGAIQEDITIISDKSIPTWKKWLGYLSKALPITSGYYDKVLLAAQRNREWADENERVIESLKLQEKGLTALRELRVEYNRAVSADPNRSYQQTLDAIKAELKLRESGVAAIDRAAEAAAKEEAARVAAEEERQATIAKTLAMEENTLTAIAAKMTALQGLRNAVDVTDAASLDYYTSEVARLQLLSEKIDELSRKRLLDAAKLRDGGVVQQQGDLYGGLEGAVADIGMNTDTSALTMLPDQIDIATGKLQEMEQEFIDLGPVLEAGAEGLAIGFGELIGNLANGGNFLAGFGQLVGGTFADMAIHVGKMAIQTGIAIAGIKLALESLNPAVAIAAGIALVALGTAVKAGLSSMANGGSGGSMAAAAGDGNTVNIGGTRDYSGQVEAQKMQVAVTGRLEARGSSLVAVIDAENNRKNLTT